MFSAGFGPGFGGGFGPGFGGPGAGGPGACGPGFGGGFGQGAGHHFFRGRIKRAAIAAAALLQEGPATAEQLSQRVSEITDGAFAPPVDKVEFVISLLAARGVATVEDGVATLTEFGEQLLAWRGVSSETVQAFLAQAGKFGDVIKLRKDLFELAGLARTIKFTGNDAQKADLTAAVATLSAAVAEAKKALYRTLADN
ncbi:hypothetical protein FZI85_17730 [Mycobacterium sp. CBMA293]|nr:MULTISPECIES: hypothetical protein [unclassified Mycolicibacterium]MUL59882.1 hypothetical protein [Mycolicibacterium sp. CBMA 335]MUL68725.1 hypothetical protein [Mycolicibacterium sp. CBMA 311]MUM06130.1 hypothetical protein [Mycolicibacterium sp. CBMA 213]MUM12856.1 hypothetical protein [Mycolicibacterium sp. CBMA 293]MUL44560.1 hypothetical protein [Mycolicibacterium sp. CBMA 360]